MAEDNSRRVLEIISNNKDAIVAEWFEEQKASGALRLDLISEGEFKSQSEEFIELFAEGCRSGFEDLNSDRWQGVWRFLEQVSRSRAQQGFTPAETSTYIFSLKQPLFAYLKQDLSGDPGSLLEQVWIVDKLFDKLGLYTYEQYQKGREEVIYRQQQDMLELSTPVVKVWEGILVVPLIGTLDSERTQKVMESLLQKIVDTGSDTAIVDITGVPTVDTLVAQYLLKMVSAASLMGAHCVICGVRPQIAQTMVQLGVAFEGITTKASLADALESAFKHLGLVVVNREPGA